ncbi:hypothetical protein F751_3961 [Auxenochlorella protothecoides]|uniref:Uncharacterized protein n=1 Tax=Auxenochlorella protothecoides TaxID=3075 RepID=A0A087SHS7_AUXPR|nr:hypothetical protein F751_3961 [Auxenochlorella protothecoides]KFM25281.1 hypothetical protein F751_3961 [Auxenochlorella protothecoides]
MLPVRGPTCQCPCQPGGQTDEEMRRAPRSSPRRGESTACAAAGGRGWSGR